MENHEAIVVAVGSLALACAFGWTATCKLMLLVASGWKKIDASGRPAASRIRQPLPAVPTARHGAGFDDDIGVLRKGRRKAGPRVGAAVVIDLREWRNSAAARARLENSRRSIAVRPGAPVARPGRRLSVVRRP